MSNVEIILSGLALAFCWVHYVNPFKKTKPFNCVKCMSGWFSLILFGLVGSGLYWPYGWLFLPIGVFAGAMFEAISMRWL
jgi:hypothetical protein